eukprot:1504708-Ditylum_brightwellii.AAC.1
MGHPQPPTPIIIDNSTAVGIANQTIKNKVQQDNFDIQWRPGKKNLGYYVTKHHAPAHHIKVHPL